MNFMLPWWSIPVIFTILAFVVAWAKSPNMKNTGQFDFWTPIKWIFCYIVALIASLLCWLVYFIIF